jgi:hypothetical protein
MKITLNGWQRMWVVVSVLMLIPTLFLMLVSLSSVDSDVIKELNSPMCLFWRSGPGRDFIGEYPAYGSECYNLRAFLHRDIAIRSVADYERHIAVSRIKEILTGLGVWLGMIVSIYLLGWSIGWVVKGFRKKTV